MVRVLLLPGHGFAQAESSAARHGAKLERLAPAERGLRETITTRIVAELLRGPTLELRPCAVEQSA